MIDQRLIAAVSEWAARHTEAGALEVLLARCVAAKERSIAHAAVEFADSLGLATRSVSAQLNAFVPKVDPQRVAFAHVVIADHWWVLEHHAHARWHLQRALMLNPRSKSAFSRLYNAYAYNDRLDEAESVARAAIAQMPDFYDAYVLLAGAQSGQGRALEALTTLERAIALAPDRAEARSRWIFESHHVDGLNDPARLTMAREYDQCLIASTPIAPLFELAATSANATPTRIGFVSTDLHDHPVGHFLRPLVSAAAARGVRFHFFQLSSTNDAVTQSLKAHAASWVSLPGMSDTEAAQAIASHRMDVLVDLMGHTPSNRLGIFGNRLAPLQLTWLGYFGTTGLTHMDGILVDEVAVPSNCADGFSEALIRLPNTRLCYLVPSAPIEVNSLPAAHNGFVTFGSFQSRGKVSARVAQVWADVLREVPNSRLRYQCKAWHQAPLAEEFIRAFERMGIDRNRIELVNATNRIDYLAAHHHIDLILDSFPFNGGTTTCEALWMGVPTLTLLGDSMASRQGASLLTAAGLADWIAESPEHYVRLAIEKANAIDSLKSLRSSLRSRVLVSPLYDGPSFADTWLSAVNRAWRSRSRDAT